MDFEFEATGTLWKIRLLGGDWTDALKKTIANEIVRQEQIYSRFLPDSELNNYNNNPVSPISNELQYALDLVEWASRVTGGVFDNRYASKLSGVGYGENRGVDLGSFAKGIIVDKVANILSAHYPYFVINAGGDILVSSNQGEPVDIAIENSTSTKIMYTLPLLNQSICTSTNMSRRWVFEGVEYGHYMSLMLYDSVSVVHNKCAVADLLSTIIFLTGLKHLDELIKQFGTLKFVLQNSGSIIIS